MSDRMGARAAMACVATGLAVGLVGPASAQQSTPFIDRISATAQPCYTGKGDPKPVIETCVKALAAINVLRSQRVTVTPHEQNMYLANSIFVTTALSRLYTDMDKGRTSRVCLSVELSWKSASEIKEDASPDYAAKLKGLRDSLVPAVTKCREEMGAPAGAPPLPGATIGPPASAKPPAAKPKP